MCVLEEVGEVRKRSNSYGGAPGLWVAGETPWPMGSRGDALAYG